MVPRVKKMFQILFVFVCAAQLTGCLFVERDRRHHHKAIEHHDRDAGIDIRVHN